MICKACGKEYDESLSPRCPFCTYQELTGQEASTTKNKRVKELFILIAVSVFIVVAMVIVLAFIISSNKGLVFKEPAGWVDLSEEAVTSSAFSEIIGEETERFLVDNRENASQVLMVIRIDVPSDDSIELFKLTCGISAKESLGRDFSKVEEQVITVSGKEALLYIPKYPVAKSKAKQGRTLILDDGKNCIYAVMAVSMKTDEKEFGEMWDRVVNSIKI